MAFRGSVNCLELYTQFYALSFCPVHGLQACSTVILEKMNNQFNKYEGVEDVRYSYAERKHPGFGTL